MKKFLKILIIFIIAICFFVSFSYAAEDICKISLTSDKTTLKAGDKVKMNISMSNIKTADGILALGGVLQYDSDVFDVLYVENQEIKDEIKGMTELDDFEILYIGDLEVENSIPWYMISIPGDEGTIAILGSSLSDPQISEQSVVTVELKVKGETQSTNTEISLTELVAVDGSQKEHTLVNNTSIEYSIQGSTKSSNSYNDDKNNLSSGSQKTSTKENIAKTETPYTGVEDATLPLIAITFIISTVSLIKYIKYIGI